MSIKSRTFATAFAVMALGTIVSGSAFAQSQGGGGRGGGSGGDSGPTTTDGKAYATVPSSRTARIFDPNDIVEQRRTRDTSKECVSPTEGRNGRKAFTGSCGPL
jgi:hypothetical protein